MFAVNETHKGLQDEKTSVISVLHSINEPKIAATDHPAEETKAFVVTLGDSSPGQYQTHIVLYLTQTQERVMYSWEDGAYVQDERTAIEEEALDFVENMGFMMDNLNLESLDDAQRVKVVQDLPVFEGSSAPLPSAEDEVQLDELDLIDDLDLLEDVERDGADDPELPDLLMDEDISGTKETSVRAGMLDDMEPPTRPGPAIDLSSPVLDDEAMQLMEEEFSRSPEELEQELESVVDALETNVKPKSAMPVEGDVPPQGQSGVFRALVRLMASF
jgi:hypothetical protein